MSLQLRPETERRLHHEAARRGQDAGTLASALIETGLDTLSAPSDAGENNVLADAPEDRLSPEQMSASLESLRNSFADIEAGRTYSADEVFAATRARFAP